MNRRLLLLIAVLFCMTAALAAAFILSRGDGGAPVPDGGYEGGDALPEGYAAENDFAFRGRIEREGENGEILTEEVLLRLSSFAGHPAAVVF